MTTRAYLYDATAVDREIELTEVMLSTLHDQQLLWIDISEFEDAEVRDLAPLLGLTRDSVRSILQRENRPRLDDFGDYFHLNINTIQEADGRIQLLSVDFVLKPNIVMTFHRKAVAFLSSFDRRVRSDSDLGELNAESFLAGLLDWHITGYFRIVEDLEKSIDKIDAHALRPRHTRDLLSEMAKLRQKIAFVRRVLTPHREAYAGLLLRETQGRGTQNGTAVFSSLGDRLEKAIDTVENARELLIGSFDMFTTQTTMKTNEIMKALTLVSFIWFPASVVVSISAMLIRTPVSPIDSAGFWIMMGCLLMIAIGTAIFARLKHWI